MFASWLYLYLNLLMFWVIKCFNHEVCIACNVSTHENKLSFQHIRPITIFVKFNNWRVHLVKLFKLFTPTSRHQMILKDIFAQLWIGTYLKSVISSYNEILLVMNFCRLFHNCSIFGKYRLTCLVWGSILSNNARLSVRINCLHQAIQRWSGETQTPGTAVADGIDISATDEWVNPARTYNDCKKIS